MTQLYILGAGAHGRVVADILHSQGLFVSGFLDDNTDLYGVSVAGVPVIGSLNDIRKTKGNDEIEINVALGNAPLRLRLANKIRSDGFNLMNAIHVRSVISPSASLGWGICVCAGAVVNPDAHIGNAVIINTGATVDHDCVLGEGAHLSPGVHLAGRVLVGSSSFLSTGVVVGPRVHIGANSIVGAGSVVVDDIPSGVLAFGVPARVIRKLDDEYYWEKLL